MRCDVRLFVAEATELAAFESLAINREFPRNGMVQRFSEVRSKIVS